MNDTDKPLVWLQVAVKSPPFSSQARLEAGFLLRRLQQGENLGLPHSRPMPSIGSRCHELRIRDREKNWRIIYRVDEDAILVIDVFNKTTRTTPQSIIELCQNRLRLFDQFTND